MSLPAESAHTTHGHAKHNVVKTYGIKALDFLSMLNNSVTIACTYGIKRRRYDCMGIYYIILCQIAPMHSARSNGLSTASEAHWDHSLSHTLGKGSAVDQFCAILQVWLLFTGDEV